MTRSMTGTRRAAWLLCGAAAVVSLTLSGCGAGQIAETANKPASVYGTNGDTVDGWLGVRGLSVAYPGPEGYPSGGTAPLDVTLYNQTKSPLTVEIGTEAPTGSSADPTRTVARAVLLTPGSSASAAPSAGPSEAGPSDAGPSEAGPAEGTPAPPEDSPSEGGPSEGAATDPSATVAAEEESAAESATASPGTAGSTEPTPVAVAGQPARITIPPSDFVAFRSTGGGDLLELVGLTTELRPGMSVSLSFQVDGSSERLILSAPVAVPLSPAPRGSADIEGGEH